MISEELKTHAVEQKLERGYLNVTGEELNHFSDACHIPSEQNYCKNDNTSEIDECLVHITALC